MNAEHESQPRGYPWWQWVLGVLTFWPAIAMLVGTLNPRLRPTLTPKRIWVGYFLFFSAGFFALVVLAILVGPESPASPMTNELGTPLPTSTPKPTATPEPPDLSDCFSPWDGSHRKFTELVKTKLNDPGSLEAIDTKYRIYPDRSSGLHYVYMDFTAKNAFGGRVRHLAKGWFHPETCEASLISIE